jgi:hypothetical protein
MIALVLVSLLPSQLLLSVAPGQSKAEVLAAISLESRVEMGAGDKQAFADNLLRTRFLETLNRFKLAPVSKEGELDVRAFVSFVRGKREGREYVLAFSERGLTWMYARIPVGVDASRDQEPGDASDRLHRLKSALRAIANEGFAIAAKDRDTFGNVFAWTGRKASTRMEAWYVPELDELRVVIHP